LPGEQWEAPAVTPAVVLFGGTTEGRQLAEFLAQAGIPALVCVATALGQEQAPVAPGLSCHVGRLDRTQMVDLLRRTAPQLVVDATHPYAAVVTANLRAACAESGLAYLRVRRPAGVSPDEDQADQRTAADPAPAAQTFIPGSTVVPAPSLPAPSSPDPASVDAAPPAVVRRFAGWDQLIPWLNANDQVIFATTGAKEARALTRVEGYQQRVVLRLLPQPDGIKACLELGYSGRNLVALQGPFGHDLNVALFQHFQAGVLVTKDSGDPGGLADKLTAARQCRVATGLIARPADVDGVTLDEARQLIWEALR
jgi:precorrin-6x reductase